MYQSYIITIGLLVCCTDFTKYHLFGNLLISSTALEKVELMIANSDSTTHLKDKEKRKTLKKQTHTPIQGIEVGTFGS